MALDLAPALEILRRETPGLAAVYLFGSAAQDALRPESDIDLAFVAMRRIDGAKRLDLQEAIAKALGRDVDLVDLANAPTILQIEAIGGGRLVDEPNEEAAALFELRVLRDYQELKARRRDIENDVVERGRVYAG